MTYLVVQDLVAYYGTTRVLDGVSFALEEGQRLCLLGPSGCGKTTTLQTIAGFVEPQSGTVGIGGRSLLGTLPEKRNIGVMFQNYALFPHLTVFDNVAFGLRMRRVAETEVRRRVAEALELVQLSQASAKLPRMLSGGEQQRIAFARAVVIRPSLLLLDEPFSNLDARLRQTMRGELLGLLQALKIATVMVTHDQEEAMAIADHIVLMRAGRIEQAGSPAALYDMPANLFTARFIGESNLLEARVAMAGEGEVALSVAGFPAVHARASGVPQTCGRGMLLLRPERLEVRPANGTAPPRPGWNAVEGIVENAMFLGHRTEYGLRVGPHRLTAWVPAGAAPPLARNAAAVVSWRSEDALFLAGEASLG